MKKFLIVIMLIGLVLPNAGYSLSTDVVPAGDRAYSFINHMINLNLVGTYSKGFTINRADRDNMAKYISLIFDGKSAQEVFDSQLINSSDLSTLSEVIDEFIMELSSKYSARLSVLLEKSMKIRNLMDEAAIKNKHKKILENKLKYGKTPSNSRGLLNNKSKADSSKLSLKKENSKLSDSSMQPLPTDNVNWETKMYNSITFRDINSDSGAAYDLNNAEKKAGKNMDIVLSYENSGTDDFGDEVVRESAYFEMKNSDLYDYMVKYANVKNGLSLQLGYRLRPDITEYTFRGKELKGILGKFKYGNNTKTTTFFGSIKMDNEASSEVKVIGISTDFQLSRKYNTRLTVISGEDINKVFSIEQRYRPNGKSLHEFEFIDSKYLGIQDHAYEYRWRQQLRKKLSLSFKYKNIGDNYTTILNPSLLTDTRKSDLRYTEAVFNYRFTPFIYNTTTLVHSNESNSLQTAPRIPIDTDDYTTVFISAVPEKPKYMLYLKDQHKTGFDSIRTSNKDDKMTLGLLKVSHRIKKLYPRVGYTYLKLDYKDVTVGIPINLLTDSKTMTYGFDYKFDRKWIAKFDYQYTNSDTTTETTAGGTTTITPSNNDSKVYDISLERRINSISSIIYYWYNENRTGTESVDKTSNKIIYKRRLRKDLSASFYYENIDYVDSITTTNSYNSDEFALTFTHQF